MKTLILKVVVIGLFGIVLGACSKSGDSSNSNCVNGVYGTAGYAGTAGYTGYGTPGYAGNVYNPALANTGCTGAYNALGINGGVGGLTGVNGVTGAGVATCVGTCTDPRSGTTAPCLPLGTQYIPGLPQPGNCRGWALVCPQISGNTPVLCQ